MQHHLPPSKQFYQPSRAFRSAIGDGSGGEINGSTSRPSPSLQTTAPGSRLKQSARYTVSYFKNPFNRESGPDHQWTGKPWDFVRKFALGNVFPEGWYILDEATGEELALAEIGTAYENLDEATLNS